MYLIQKFRKSTSSGKKLADRLGIKIYTPTIKPKFKSLTAINWGLSKKPNWYEGDDIINHPSAVLGSSNKLTTFNTLSANDVHHVPYTTSKDTAKDWIHDGHKAVCRTTLNGSSGEGIVIAKDLEDVVDAPLYTQYIRKVWEYRVHVAFSKVIYIQQKRRLTSEQLEARGINNRNKYIRNLANGYIFSSNLDHASDSDVASDLRIESLISIDALGLDFGAVDLIVTSDEKVYVLEVNSAPGLEGSTLDAYVSAFQEFFERSV